MIKQFMEGLVLDIVLSNVSDDVVEDLNSGVTVLEVDQLTMTYIVLALESRLGIELPTHLEDARTIADLVSGVLEALRADAEMKHRHTRRPDYLLALSAATGSANRSGARNVPRLSPSRPRRKTLIQRVARVE